MKIIVCDDSEIMAAEWVEAIKTAVGDKGSVERIERDATTKNIDLLVERKVAINKNLAPESTDPTVFDQCDVLVVDYDLVHLHDDHGRTTGEGVARLARTYSDCGAIIVMNQYKTSQFDLSMKGNPGSFADLNIDADLVGQPALWSEIPAAAGVFKPSTWTPMHKLKLALDKLAGLMLSAGPDAPILSVAEFPEELVGRLSDAAFGFLDETVADDEALRAVTLKRFLQRQIGDDAINLWSIAPQYAARLAAARFHKWLDLHVLRPLEVVIDAPHLLEKMPFLMSPTIGVPGDAAAWQHPDVSGDSALNADLIAKFKLETCSMILGRDVFHLIAIEDDLEILKMQDAWLSEVEASYLFSEDTSRFLADDSLTTFRAEFHNFSDRRHVEVVPGITYGPQRRFAFG